MARPKFKDRSKVKSKIISFKIAEDDLNKLQRMSENLGAGTASNFVRELANKVLNTSGASDVWRSKELE